MLISHSDEICQTLSGKLAVIGKNAVFDTEEPVAGESGSGKQIYFKARVVFCFFPHKLFAISGMSYILLNYARDAGIEEFRVEILYKKLWKLLIDRQMTQTEMRKAAGISSSTLAMMNKNLPVTTAVLEKICKALNCRPSDIVSAKTLRSLKIRKVTESSK